MTHPDDLAADEAQFNRVMAGELDGYTMDKRWIRKDGRVIDSIMAARCLRRTDGSVDYFVGLVLDTTERIQAEEKLRRSEANLAEGQRISHTGSWAWNVATGECFWSLEHYRIFGLAPETFKPTKDNTQRMIHPEDLPLVEQTLEQAVRERSHFEVDYRLVRPDGSIRYHHGLGHPVVKEGGEQEFIGSVMDVTERKCAEEALQKLQTELAHVTRVTMMGELAASIAHEINQPLGAIVNNSNVGLRLVNGARELPKELREILSDIVHDANRTSAIVARIRALAKKSIPEKTSLQLGDVVADVLMLAQGILAERRIEVRTELDDDLPQVSGDRVQLQQVLLNLVMNGVEAMSGVQDERRILTIGVQRDELAGRPAIRITVRDLGCGFRPEDSERLFESFYTTKSHGMGLGLWISRSIVEAHGGRLWATLNDGPGATFSCALPSLRSDTTTA
jgi:PAS domain S-box-containing protein